MKREDWNKPYSEMSEYEKRRFEEYVMFCYTFIPLTILIETIGNWWRKRHAA